MNSKEPRPSEIPKAAGLKRLPVEISDLLQVLIETVKDYAILLLDKDGNVLTWNAAAQRIQGWTADGIVGQWKRIGDEANLKGWQKARPH